MDKLTVGARAAQWVLQKIVGDRKGDAAFGDLLEELHVRIGRGRSPRFPGAWLLINALAISIPLLLTGQWRQGAGLAGPSASFGGLAWDARQAARSLVKRPAYMVTTIAVLTLGVGLTATTFSAVNRLLFKPLPYHEPQELVQLSETAPGPGTMDLSLPDFHAWASEARSFESIAAFDDSRFLLSATSEMERIDGAVISPSLFDVLGVNLLLGRPFVESEGRAGEDGVVIISHDLWTERFGSDPRILGASIVLNGRNRTIVGVAPPAFHFPEIAKVWVPLARDPATADAGDYTFDAIARLRDGVTIEEARIEGDLIVKRAIAARGGSADIGVDIYPLKRADVSTELELATVLLFLAVGGVLGMACLNLSVLIAGRGLARHREFAVRAALGATRARIVRLIVSESAILCVVGGLGGLLVTSWLNGVLNTLLPSERPFWMILEVEPVVVGFVVLVVSLSVIITGFLPGIIASRPAGIERSRTPARSFVRLQSVLVAVQIAASFGLLAGAGSSVGALKQTATSDLGVNVGDVVLLTYEVPPWIAQDSTALAAIHNRVQTAVTSLPGVDQAGLANGVPVESAGDEVVVSAALRVEREHLPVARSFVITPQFFNALAMRVVRGAAPDDNSPGGVIVSQALAERLWPGQDPVGRSLWHGIPGSRSPDLSRSRDPARVIGVVNDVRRPGAMRDNPLILYFPSSSYTAARAKLVARVNGDVRALGATIRAAVSRSAPEAFVVTTQGMHDVVRAAVSLERTYAVVFAVFGAIALLLASIGLWGVVAFTAESNERDLAVRRALGAFDRQILVLVTSRAALIALPGIAGGAALAVAIVAGLRTALPGFDHTGSGTEWLSGLVFLSVIGAASLLPGLRSLRTDPAGVLRRE